MRRSRDGDALSQACEREGCPICLVTLARMERVMDFWQYEWASEMENRQILIHSKGFCARHTWQLTQLPSLPTPFALAMVYRSILPDLLEDVQRDLARVTADKALLRVRFWRRIRWRKRDQSEQSGAAFLFHDCPFCQRQEEIERDLIQELLLLLPCEAFQTKLNEATGLCLAHFTRATREAQTTLQRATLLECQRASLQRNMAELEELVRKHDYRFLQEPRGDEMTAWRRAAELLVGNRGVR